MAELKPWRAKFDGRSQDLAWLEMIRAYRKSILSNASAPVHEGAPKEFSSHFLAILDSGLATAAELYCAFRLYGAQQRRGGWAREGKVMGLGVFFGTGARAKSPWEGWVEAARPRLQHFLGVLRTELGALPGDAGWVDGSIPSSVAPRPSGARSLGASGSGLPALSKLDGPMPGLEDLLHRRA